MIGCIGVSPVWLTSYDDEVAEFLTPASAWITTVRTQRTISLIVLAAPLHDEGSESNEGQRERALPLLAEALADTRSSSL